MTAKIYAFNHRAKGFSDRDGQPVDDATADLFRYKARGPASKTMSREELAALIAAHSSEQINLLLAAASGFPDDQLHTESLDEFKRNDGIVHAWLLSLTDTNRAELVTMAIDLGYECEEQSILVDVLRLAQLMPVSIFHEHDGNTGRAVALLEQWCDEEIERRRNADQFSQST